MKLSKPVSNKKFELNQYDELLQEITAYTDNPNDFSTGTYETARLCLLDSLACAMLALSDEGCKRRIGAYVPGTNVPNGINIPGTTEYADPIRAAFSITALIRWLDFNDTWLAAEWGHPSDNLGSIWSTASFINNSSDFDCTYTVRDILNMMIKSYEIQGVIALNHAFNRVGLDHVLLVKVASTAVSTKLLGGAKEDIIAAVSNAWIDGQSLRIYRHGINTGPRKSWAAADAVMRAVNLAWLSVFANEPGCPEALSAKTWGFQDVMFNSKEVALSQQLESYVMDNILFKVSFPAEFHAQTAVECGVKLHEQVKDRLHEIEKIEVETQEAAMRIINKTGSLTNYADRDHCLQYMLAVSLIEGDLTEHHYSDNYAQDPTIDILRAKMHLQENPEFTKDYMNSKKRSIANSVKIYFKDGTSTENVRIDYPLGHRLRREEAKEHLRSKYNSSLENVFKDDARMGLEKLFDMPLENFMNLSLQEFTEKWKRN